MYTICLFVEKADESADWKVNGAGFHHSHQHGFGLLSAWRLVSAAKVRTCTPQRVCSPWLAYPCISDTCFWLSQVWESVPFLTSYQSSVIKEEATIPTYPDELIRIWKGSSVRSSPAGCCVLDSCLGCHTVLHKPPYLPPSLPPCLSACLPAAWSVCLPIFGHVLSVQTEMLHVDFLDDLFLKFSFLAHLQI